MTGGMLESSRNAMKETAVRVWVILNPFSTVRIPGRKENVAADPLKAHKWIP